LPRNNDDVNEEWISDKTRHVADGLRTQRLDQPYARKNGRLEPVSWEEALRIAAERLTSAKPERIGAIAGDLAAAEEMFALKDLMRRLGVPNLDCRQYGEPLDPRLGRSSYIFNSTINGIEEADVLLIVGSNPRIEAAVLNARILKRWRRGGMKVGLVGEKVDLTYPYEHLGTGPQTLAEIAAGRHSFMQALDQARRPMVIVGSGAIARPDGAAVLSLAAQIALAAMRESLPEWNGFNVLHAAAARVAGLDLGFVPEEGGRDLLGMLSGDMEVVYLLGADEIDMSALGDAFVIYQGTHGDAGAHRADLILPAAAYTEKSGTYVNLEGRAQMTTRSVFPPGAAKEDWAIIRALSPLVGHQLPYDDIFALRAAMYQEAPSLARIGMVKQEGREGVEALARMGGGQPGTAPLRSIVKDFYLTNPIARASAIMAELSRLKALADSENTVEAAE